MNFAIRAFVLAAVAAPVFGGCLASPVGDPEVASTQEDIGSTINIWRDIPMNGLPTWALSANLLTTSQRYTPIFTSHPLAPSMFQTGGPLAVPLYDVGTRMVLRYAIRCAFTSSQSFSLSGTDPDGVSWNIQESGVVGLCPEWATAGANEACQERMGPCLLAGNNPLSTHVPLSIRGVSDGGALVALRSAVPTVSVPVAESANEAGDLIPSFQSCSGSAYGMPDCGWDPAPNAGLIGLCTPGEIVAVGTGGVPACGATTTLGASTNDTVLRVCPGLRGCADSGKLASNDDSCPGSNLQSYVTFTCPQASQGNAMVNGKVAFNAMIASYNRSLALAPVTTAATGSQPYPSAETSIFSLREGAFFGNMFEPAGLRISYDWDPVNLSLKPTTLLVSNNPAVYQHLYACNDPAFGATLAHETARVCATGTGNCLAQPLGNCTQWCGASAAPAAYGSCTWNGRAYTSLTTYLRTPYDIFPQ